MSLANIKAKEAKGKQKLLPKLKTILANPNKVKCPTLNEEELKHLQTILQNAIISSKLDTKCYASNKGIQLGLESSLRSINGQRSSCVFISLSIKPSHIVSLIARNAEIKDETQPVYAQPRLEEFLEHIFGIRALCMVLPKDLSGISEEISTWVQERKKTKRAKAMPSKITKPLKKKNLKTKLINLETTEDINDLDESSETLSKSLSGDFISFTNNDNVDLDKLKLDKEQVFDALSKIIDKVPNKPKDAEKIVPMEVEFCKDSIYTEDVDKEVLEDSDDFLCEYQALTVHKIKGNPNKKPKKKRRKNKNKQK